MSPKDLDIERAALKGHPGRMGSADDYDEKDAFNGRRYAEPSFYSSMQRVMSRSRKRSRTILALVAISVATLFFLFSSRAPLADEFRDANIAEWSPPMPWKQDVVDRRPGGWRSRWSSSSWFGPPRYDASSEIPNIVHFVRQINRDENYVPQAPFRVEFRHLMSYFSSSFYLKPERIYFWTDTPQEMLDDARLNGDAFTRALFRIPNIEFMPATFPNVTSSGVKIDQYAHRSDFVRTVVMARMGGVYLDDDAWVLRDLTPLRRSGFDNVFSLDDGARIAQAAFLSRPLNPLMLAFARLQDVVFNGDWLRASNDLVTALMVHYSRAEGSKSALTLEKDAFFPGYWIGDALNMYYEVHDDDPNFREPETPQRGQDITTTFQYDFDWGWRRDWRRTWIVHGFSNELRARKAYHLFKEFQNFTPAYVLSRRANIARALFPALKEMLDTGLLQLDQHDLVASQP
ncbi:hypothetical protein BDZ90DRAFT_228849 [Jaminaea rosea]|uniref:Glycosyltransferase family 32 protein n=1 Tax=Jaminaea rosea TaxID=1569628 RepID=A0A316UK79_9BASI|nr:hypothetical protein BDZ90DRAFT_228849 [Jaminaea rosea]PWN24373.1 hypothetical protein BDZ90DRAFT_228849 [Jaminaea rosea]